MVTCKTRYWNLMLTVLTTAFWLSHWAGQYAKSHGDFPTGYYIGIYAVFAVSGLAMSFALTRFELAGPPRG